MIGLMFLAAFVIWVVLTVIVMIIVAKIMRRILPNKKWASWAGAFLGFMLAMGGVLLYWYIEYLLNVAYANKMCQQAGMTIYVTPEEWRNATDKNLAQLRSRAPFEFKKPAKAHYGYPSKKNIIFEGNEYEFISPTEKLNIIDIHIYHPDNNYHYVSVSDYVFLDTKKILFFLEVKLSKHILMYLILNFGM